MLKVFQEFKLPKNSQNYRRKQPHGSAEVFLLQQILEQTTKNKKLLIIICDSLNRIEELSHQIKWIFPNLKISTFPDWETLPYDRFSPHKEITSDRIWALYQLLTTSIDLLLLSSSAALTRLLPKEYLAQHGFVLKVGDFLEKKEFIQRLNFAGYQNVSQVISPGEWSTRGGIIDLFPMSSSNPCRIEINESNIASLRLFDPDTQKTIYPINDLNLLPAREYPLDEHSINRFRQNFREHFSVNPINCPIYKAISNNTSFAGIEYYLPLFYEQTATIFDYLPKDAIWYLDLNIQDSLKKHQQLIIESYNNRKNDDLHPILPISKVFLSVDDFYNKLTDFARISINNEVDHEIQALDIHNFENNKLSSIEKLSIWLTSINKPIFISTESAGRLTIIADLLREHQIEFETLLSINNQSTIYSSDIIEIAKLIDQYQHQPKIFLLISPIESGFISEKFIWISEQDLFPHTAHIYSNRRSKARLQTKVENWIRDLAELNIGNLIVHQNYGIGKYLGLINLGSGESENEFLHLEYANKAKLYVPITQLHLISRLSTVNPEIINLQTLGNGEWQKTINKAQKQAYDTAAELFDLYSLRYAKTPPTMQIDKIELERFAEGFGYELTIDQENTIEAVVADLTSDKISGASGIIKLSNNSKKIPMDRLVCGDVGFGKTEVAMRSAFVTMSSGYQVGLLCPTTLLVEQHLDTFLDRFAKYTNNSGLPFNIVALSRFRSGSEQKRTIENIANGSVDLVIGTHRILQKDIKFKNLGLIIIDEEHRFGVRHKETLKKIRANAHVLAMSATPIPRTLSLSLEGIRDFSVISTPPSRRLAIKTVLGHFHKSQIREAAIREFRRGGQVFFLHNEVQSISIQQKKIQEILPEANIAIAHGQMPEKELEQVMRAFRNLEYNLLLCTTIIENGIDIPNANTILINKAERFGIAQLHQLRGRVGRSHHQAYCYLLINDVNKTPKPVKRRLDALCASEELGSGFYLAMHDLEIRGAGEILGESQSGTIEQIGYELYFQMLTQAARNFQKNGDTNININDFSQTAEINLHASAFIPDFYCPDITERIKIYKRLSSCEDLSEISEIRSEMGDRFGIERSGNLPEKVENLLTVHRLRISAKMLGIYKIEANAEKINFYFNLDQSIESISPEKILEILQKEPNWSLTSSERIQIKSPSTKITERINLVYQALEKIKSNTHTKIH